MDIKVIEDIMYSPIEDVERDIDKFKEMFTNHLFLKDVLQIKYLLKSISVVTSNSNGTVSILDKTNTYKCKIDMGEETVSISIIGTEVEELQVKVSESISDFSGLGSELSGMISIAFSLIGVALILGLMFAVIGSMRG